MEQTITINVPEGKKPIYNESTQTVSFVDIKPIRSKSWEEFCKNHTECKGEYYISSSSAINELNNHYNRTDLTCNNSLATKEDAEGILALIQLTRLYDEWVGDWKPNYKGEWIYSISYYQNYIDILNNRFQHVLLSFPTKDMAQDFLNCFKDLIEKAKRFI